MKDEITRWQQDAQAAFAWIAGMYDQTQTLWDDAERYFTEAGWQTSVGGGLGGNAMSQSDLSEWPFIYLKALAALSKESAAVASGGSIPVFGISFYDEARVGPMCFAGAVKWSGTPTAEHWAIYAALCGYKDRFRKSSKAGEIIHCAHPTPAGMKRHPGFEEIRWFELPVGGISTAKQLKRIVAASIEMVEGSDAEALAVCREHDAS